MACEGGHGHALDPVGKPESSRGMVKRNRNSVSRCGAGGAVGRPVETRHQRPPWPGQAAERHLGSRSVGWMGGPPRDTCEVRQEGTSSEMGHGSLSQEPSGGGGWRVGEVTC